MFDHVTIRVSDRAASEDFYAVVLRTLVGSAVMLLPLVLMDLWHVCEVAAAMLDAVVQRGGRRSGIGM